jgi:hypothetical protein
MDEWVNRDENALPAPLGIHLTVNAPRQSVTNAG